MKWQRHLDLARRREQSAENLPLQLLLAQGATADVCVCVNVTLFYSFLKHLQAPGCNGPWLVLFFIIIFLKKTFVVAKVKPWFFNCQTAIFHSRSDCRQHQKSLPGGETSTFQQEKNCFCENLWGSTTPRQHRKQTSAPVQSLSSALGRLRCPFPGQALHSKHLFGLLSNNIQQQ